MIVFLSPTYLLNNTGHFIKKSIFSDIVKRWQGWYYQQYELFNFKKGSSSFTVNLFAEMPAASSFAKCTTGTFTLFKTHCGEKSVLLHRPGENVTPARSGSEMKIGPSGLECDMFITFSNFSVSEAEDVFQSVQHLNGPW